jgi:hypothetical protein
VKTRQTSVAADADNRSRLAKHAAQDDRVERLEAENRHLRQLIGSLSLEKKLLLDRLAVLEPAGAKD